MQALSPMLVSDFHSARISNSLEFCPIHRGMQIHAKQLYTIMKTTKDCCSIIPVGISSKSVSGRCICLNISWNIYLCFYCVSGCTVGYLHSVTTYGIGPLSSHTIYAGVKLLHCSLLLLREQLICFK